MNVISFLVYLFVLGLLVWGMKITPKNSISCDCFSSSATKNLKGLLAFCVLCHHVSQQEAFRQTGTMSFFVDIGYLFVAMFFFISGYGLIKSLDSKPEYLKSFMKKRALPILVSYYVMIAFYAVFKIAGIKVGLAESMGVSKWICSIIGVSQINTQSWFVVVIFIMYSSFCLIYRNVKNRNTALALVVLVSIIQGLIFIVMGHFPWFLGEKNWWRAPDGSPAWSVIWGTAPWYLHPMNLWFTGEWWVNGTLAFASGIFIAEKETKIIEFMKKNFWIKFMIFASIVLAYALVFVLKILPSKNYWNEWGSDGILNNACCYLLQNVTTMLVPVAVYFLMLKVHSENKVLSFLGTRSLEVYLMQEICLFSYRFIIAKYNPAEDDFVPVIWKNNLNLVLYFFAVSISVVLLACIYQFCHKKVSKLLLK